jgi:hypothetical protein
VKSYWFLFWACAVIWGFLAGLLLLMLTRQGRTERRLSEIESGIGGDAADRVQESSGS